MSFVDECIAESRTGMAITDSHAVTTVNGITEATPSDMRRHGLTRPDARLGFRRRGKRGYRPGARFWNPYVGPLLIRLRYEGAVRDALREQV